MSEYDFSEDDLKATAGGQKSDALPIGDYTFAITSAEAKKDKNGKAYLSLELTVETGSQKKRKAWDNYLTLDKSNKQFHRTASFLRAIGHKGGIPAGAPGGQPASALVGTFVDAQITHEYENVPGQQWPVASWSKQFKEIQASGALEGIKPSARVGYYSISDLFEGVGAPDEAADDQWG